MRSLDHIPVQIRNLRNQIFNPLILEAFNGMLFPLRIQKLGFLVEVDECLGTRGVETDIRGDDSPGVRLGDGEDDVLPTLANSAVVKTGNRRGRRRGVKVLQTQGLSDGSVKGGSGREMRNL